MVGNSSDLRLVDKNCDLLQIKNKENAPYWFNIAFLGLWWHLARDVSVSWLVRYKVYCAAINMKSDA